MTKGKRPQARRNADRLHKPEAWYPFRSAGVRLTLLAAGTVLAVATGPAAAVCKITGGSMSPTVLGSFLSYPKSILATAPMGGDRLKDIVSQLAASTDTGTDTIMSVASRASNRQAVAIGEGFAVASSACESQDSDIVQRIKNAVKSSGSSALRQSFYQRINQDVAPPAPSSVSRSATSSDGQLPDDVVSKPDSQKLPDPFGDLKSWH